MTEEIFNDFLSLDLIFKDRYEQIEYWAKNIFIEGAILEFGVWKGNTINLIANTVPDKKIYGFDSFKGLPEKWVRTADKKRFSDKGEFALSELPEVEENVVLIEGWFNESIPFWLKKNKKKISLLHIDCDLYTSTKTVLNQLNNQIVKGTIIIFDELCDWNDQGIYDLWREGEAKALLEWSVTFNRKIKILSRTEWLEGAILVLK